MSEKRDLAIVGLILGLLGGALILARGVDFAAFTRDVLAYLTSILITLIVGLGILFGSVLIYRGSYSTGGILNLVLGVVGLVLGRDSIGAVLAIISGVVGFLANEARS